MGLERKRKSLNALQNNEKKRKSIVEKKSSSSENTDEHSEHDNGLIEEVKSEIPVISRWPQDDIEKLLSQIESTLPKNDTSIFRSRLAKLDWEKVRFDNYNKEECQSTWLAIQDQLRTHKTLGDLVHDAKNVLATKGIDTYLSKQNQIQKPRTAYMLYYMDILPKYRKKNPNFKLTQLTQLIAEKYKNLAPDKKQAYVDQALKLKTEYQALVSKTNEGFKPFKPKSLEIDKPKPPFQIFLETKLSEAGSQYDKVELQGRFKDKWDKMSQKKKSKWIKLAQEREKVYLIQLKEGHKNDPAFTMPTKSALTKSDRDILDSQSGKPKKPPTNNYGLYSKEMLSSNEYSEVPPKERMTLLAKKWKLLSNDEKQIYTDKLKIITDRYKTEYDAYLKTLSAEDREIELTKNKSKPKKVEPKVVPRINAREGITEKPKKKNTPSKYNSKTKTFENEPKPIPYTNSFELYRSKVTPNEKHQITSLEDWNKKPGKKQIQFDLELKLLKKLYMKNLKVFLKSLSEDDLKLYLKLRKPELMTSNDNDNSDNSSSESENEESSSSSDDENENENENENDDDDEDDDDDDSDDSDDSD